MSQYRKALKQAGMTLERNLRPPHESQPLKRCRTCDERLANNFLHFPKIIFGTQRFGPRYTTGDVCLRCKGAAVKARADARKDAWRKAGELIEEDAMKGEYLALKCNYCCERAVGTGQQICDVCADVRAAYGTDIGTTRIGHATSPEHNPVPADVSGACDRGSAAGDDGTAGADESDVGG